MREALVLSVRGVDEVRRFAPIDGSSRTTTPPGRAGR
jgi:hypothetical protein